MQIVYPRIFRSDETTRGASGPQGWKGKLYKLFNDIRFNRKDLHLSPGLFMSHTDLVEGHIKVGGRIDPGALSIGFYGSPDTLRISGAPLVDQRMTISYNGCGWDAVSKAPAYGVSIHFSPELTARIVSPDAHVFLMNAPKVTGERFSLVSTVTPMGEGLRKAIQSSILLAEEAESAQNYDGIFTWMADDLVSVATCLIDEITEETHATLATGEERKFQMARKIERFLWEHPGTAEETPASLDELAAHFNCSRRTVQKAVQEHFGVGFTALKRSVRLHQVNSVLNSGATDSVTSAALEHDFDQLGRFSNYYKKMFGVLPSESLRTSSRNESRSELE